MHRRVDGGERQRVEADLDRVAIAPDGAALDERRQPNAFGSFLGVAARGAPQAACIDAVDAEALRAAPLRDRRFLGFPELHLRVAARHWAPRGSSG